MDDNSKNILVTQPSMPSLEEYVSELKDIWNSKWLTNMGQKHRELQAELQNYLEAPRVELFTNGHMALELSLQAMKLHGEVITTPFTFVSTTHAIVRNGLKPVFCDINEKDYTIDVNCIESLITDKTCAIMPVHVYGNVCDVEQIESIARKHGLKVLYDAAHAFGVKYKGKGIANYGDASCFSFHATKVFNTIEGGATVYSDAEYGTDLYRLKNFGIRDEETVDAVGANAKMNEFCAAMGLCNLRHIGEEIAKRRILVERYRENLSGLKGVKINDEQPDVESNYAYFPVYVNEKEYGHTRDDVYTELKKNGIIARKYFYPLTNSFACYRNQYDVEDTPVAYRISKGILTLPLYADLDVEVVDKICRILKEFGRNA